MDTNQTIPTGFKCGADPLFVGDILSISSGYGGFARITEMDGHFFLEEHNVYSQRPSGKILEVLAHDIGTPYRKVDKNDPFREPPFPIHCDQCLETIIGYFDVEDGSITWTDDCGEHYDCQTNSEIAFNGEVLPDYERQCGGRCKACVADPKRKSKTVELMEYLVQRSEAAGVDLRSTYRPILSSKEDVDRYIEEMLEIQKLIRHRVED